jgi:hypothetical protein
LGAEKVIQNLNKLKKGFMKEQIHTFAWISNDPIATSTTLKVRLQMRVVNFAYLMKAKAILL